MSTSFMKFDVYFLNPVSALQRVVSGKIFIWDTKKCPIYRDFYKKLTANPPVHGITVPLKEMSALWGIRFIYNHLLQRSRINKCLVLTSDIVGNYYGKTKNLKTKMAKYTLFFIRTHFIKTLRLRLPKNYEQFKNNDQAGCKDPKKLQRREIDQIN